MQEIYAWLKNIVFFMIFLTILSNLLGKSDFKKYINVITGLLLVLVTMGPVLQLFSLDENFLYHLDSTQFHLETTEIAREMKDAQESQRQRILSTYREEIIQQISELLRKEQLVVTSAMVDIEEDMNASNYATIKRLTVYASYLTSEESNNSTIQKITIPKIKIESQTMKEDKTTKEQETFLTPMEIHIKSILSDFYNIDADNINISIQGGQHE